MRRPPSLRVGEGDCGWAVLEFVAFCGFRDIRPDGDQLSREFCMLQEIEAIDPPLPD